MAIAPDPITAWLMAPDAGGRSFAPLSELLRPAWMKEGACRTADPGLFFAERGASITKQREAKAICAECPVQPECLAYAMRDTDTYGTWGGTTRKERLQMRAAAPH